MKRAILQDIELGNTGEVSKDKINDNFSKLNNVISDIDNELVNKPDKSDIAIGFLYLGFDVPNVAALTKPTITNPDTGEVITLKTGHAVRVLDQVDSEGKPYYYQYDGTNWNKTNITDLPSDVMRSGGTNKTGQQLDDEKADKTELSKLQPSGTLQHPVNLYFIGGYDSSAGSITPGDINLYKTSGYIKNKIGDRIKIKGAYSVTSYDGNMQNRQTNINTASMANDFVVFTFIRDGLFAINYEFKPSGSDNKIGDINNILVAFYPLGADIVEDKVDKEEGSRLITEQEAETIIDAKKINAFDISFEETDNILNPDKIIEKALVNEVNGTLIFTGAAPSYDTFLDIEIEANTFYSGLTSAGTPQSFRKIAFMTKEGGFISGIGTAVTEFTTPENTGLVRLSVSNIVAGYNPENIGLFKGENPTWEPFEDIYTIKLKDNTPTPEKVDTAAASIADVRYILSGEKNDLSFNIALSVITFTYLTGVIQGYIKENRGYNGNNMFNFYRFDLNGIATNISDDAAPTHTMGTTIGANHGQGYNRATISGHGKTNANKGEEWMQNGTKFYLMNVISASQIDFLSENKGTKASPKFTNVQQGDITRNGDTLTITAVTGRQLYPSIKNHKLNVLQDSIKLISNDGSYTANHVDIVERYDIMSTDSTLQKIIASAGTSGDPVYDGDSMITIENIYRFFSYPSVVGLFNAIVLDDIAFNDFMFSQAAKISVLPTPYYYVPNSLANADYDFRKPLQYAWDGSKPALFFDSSMWADQNNPVNRIIQYSGNLGFAIGFIPTIGVGKSLQDYTDRTFEIRNNTGKVYPHGVEVSKVGDTLNRGDAFSCGMYRCYMDLTKVRTAYRLSYYYYEIDNELHLCVDYSASIQLDHIDLDMSNLNGRKIEVIQSSNTELKTVIYNNGIYINANYVEGETCFIVLKI